MPKDEAQLLPKGAYWALAVLTTLNIINVWHRYLIYNLSAVSVEDCDVCDDVSFIPLCFIDEITSSTSEETCLMCRESYDTAFYNLKDGACIDNTEYGILAGVGFTLMFAMATLLAGRLTDTLDRRLLHTGAILVWSMAAAAHGMCTCFSCLLVSRIFLGIGEAFNAPACYALITLYFPHSRRATANGFYSTGTYLGSAMSSLCLALAVLIGWRNTAFFSGACGVVAGAILFFTVEHNPVMPPSSAGYTSLPDDSPKVGNVAGTTPAIDSLSGYQVPAVVRRKMLRKGTVYAGDSNSGGGVASRGGGGGPPTPILSPSVSSKEGGYFSNTPGGGALAGFAGPDVGTGGDPSLAYASSEDDDDEAALLLGIESKPKRRHGAPTAAGGGRGFGRKGAKRVVKKPTGNPFAPGFDSSAAASGDGGNLDWGWYVENPSGTGGHGCHDGFDGVGGSGGGGAGGGGGGGRAEAEAPRKSHDLRQALRTIASNRVVLLLFAASSARMVATWSIASYLAIYFHRAFPSQTSLFSIYNAVFLAVGGVSSSWGGGVFADRLRVYNEGVLGYLPALGSLAAIFPVAVVLFSPKFSVAVTGLFFTYFVGECWLGPGMALLQVELPKELAGTSVAILLFLNSVFCNVGPWFIMWQDDGLSSVNRPLFATLFASYLCSFFLFSAVGFMVSQRQRQRRAVLRSMESAGLLEDGGEGDVPGEKPSSLYTRQSARSCEGNHRRRSSSGGNICEMVRRTFSFGARRPTSWSNDKYLHDGGDRRPGGSLDSGFDTSVSSGGRHESSVGLLDKNKTGVSSNASAKTGTATTEVGEREAMLMGSWSGGMANGRRG